MRLSGDRSQSPGAALLWTLAAFLLLVGHALLFRFAADDAFISFRYAQNLLDGRGLVFNPGETVEGYSNYLWILLASFGMKTGLPALLWARIMGGAAMAGVLALTPGIVTILAPRATELNPLPGRVAQLLLAAVGAGACWMFSGLETPLFTLWTVLAWRLALSRNAVGVGIVGILLVLTRPEGLAIAGIFMLWATAPGESGSLLHKLRRGLGWIILILGAGIFFIWRHDVYGWWLANSYHVRSTDLAVQVRSGLPYALSFILSYVLSLAVIGGTAGLGGGFPSLKLRDTLFGLILVVFWLVFTTVFGGDSLGMFRLFVPLLPLLVISSVALAAEAGWLSHFQGALVFTLVVGLALLPPSLWGPERGLVSRHMSEQEMGGWMLAGQALEEHVPRSATLALGPVGYIPWKTGLKAYDFRGLVDPEILHLPQGAGDGRSRPEIIGDILLLERRPDYILIGNVDITDQPRTTPIPPFDQEAPIVGHEIFSRDYELVHLPVAKGKYLNLYRRKGAPPFR